MGTHTNSDRQRQKPKILLGSLIADAKDYILPLWLSHIQGLTYSNLEYFIYDTTPDQGDHALFARKFTPDNIVISHSPELNRGPLRQVLANGFEEIRKFFLSTDCDGLLILECDVFPPLNVIEKLVAEDRPVICGPYLTGDGASKYLMLQECDYHEEQAFLKAFQMSFDSSFGLFDGTVRPVYGAGLGCVLITRDIARRIRFRWDPADESFPDSFFYQDLFIRQIPNCVDTSFVCRHENQNWGAILNK
mgnify:CR=1 FL=1